MNPCVTIGSGSSPVGSTMHPTALSASDRRRHAFGAGPCPGSTTSRRGENLRLHGIVRSLLLKTKASDPTHGNQEPKFARWMAFPDWPESRPSTAFGPIDHISHDHQDVMVREDCRAWRAIKTAHPNQNCREANAGSNMPTVTGSRTDDSFAYEPHVLPEDIKL